MAAGPLTIKLRCASWGQLDQIYKRDLTRSAVFLKTTKPPPLGTKVRINLTLPSETLIILAGEISEHIGPGGLDGRGPGVDIRLATVPQSAMWLIESALSSARKQETSAVRAMPVAATNRAKQQARSRPMPSRRDAELDSGADLVDAEADLVAALREEFEHLRKLNPFQTLDVPYDADDQTVRNAFGRLTKKYHPDRFARYQSVEARELAGEVFILIRDAYRRIGSPRAREQTLKALGRQPPPRPSSRPPQQEAAPLPPPPPPGLTDELFDGPATDPAAAKPLDLAPPAIPSRDEASQLLEQNKIAEALKAYTLAAKRNPGDRRARAGVELCEGLKALTQKDRLEAAQRFEMVLELDPENERAARELADMRRQATQDRKGLMARLLGKKE